MGLYCELILVGFRQVRLRWFGECGSGLISWVWATVVWQVWLILGFDFGGCDLILVAFVVLLWWADLIL